MGTDSTDMKHGHITEKIIGAAFAVHNTVGQSTTKGSLHGTTRYLCGRTDAQRASLSTGDYQPAGW